MKEKELLDYWIILYRKKWLIVFIMIVAIATTTAFSAFTTDVYQSKAVFFIPGKPDVISFLSSDYMALTRAPLLPTVAEEPHSPYLGLLKSKTMRERVQKEFPHKTIDDLRSDVDFRLSNEYMMQVYARDYNSEKAAGIANAYVKHLDKLIDSYSKSLTDRHQKMIEREITIVKEKLDNARGRLKEYQEMNGSVALEADRDQLVSQKTKLQSEVDTDRVAMQEIATKISAFKQQLESEAELLSSSDFVITSQLLEKLREDLVNVEVTIATSKTEIKESHPDIIVLNNKFESIKKNISAEIDRLVKSQVKDPSSMYETIRRQLVNLFVEQQNIQARLKAYEIVIGDIEKRIRQLPELFAKSDVLNTEIIKFKQISASLEMDLQEIEMQQERETQNVVLVEKATPSENPSFPDWGLNLIVASLLGLVGGVFYAFFINYLQETRGTRVMKLVKALEISEREG